MSKFEILILPIDKVENHPNADRLSLNHIRGYQAVSNKSEKGEHRYKEGDLVAYIPVGSMVPESLLRARGYWDTFKDRGFLGGENHNVVMPINLRRIVSRGLIFPLEEIEPHISSLYLKNGDGHARLVKEGDDVTQFLGITHSVTPYPVLTGTVEAGPVDVRYSIEELQKYPKLLEGHQIIITELLHGIHCVIGYDRTLIEPFLVMNNMGHRFYGDNIYTQVAKPVWEHIKRYLEKMPAVERFYIHGVIIGPGIQDITYGLDKPEFRALDVLMGLMGAGRDSIPFGFIGVRKYELLKWLDIPTAPILWGGKFGIGEIDQLTDGPSAIGGGMRKGVVITSEDENFIGGKRPILKNISDKYLLRSKATEYK